MTSPARTLRRLALAAGAVVLLLTSMPAVARTETPAPGEPSASARAPERPGMRRLQEVRDRHREMDPRDPQGSPIATWLNPRRSNRDAPPANDAFAAAQLITWLPTTLGTTNREATTEPGEPIPSCATVGVAGTTVPFSSATVWYRFTARVTGRLVVSADGGALSNPVVAVYRGASLGGLTEVACNDNEDAGSLGSSAYVQVTKGQVYVIQLGSVLGQPVDGVIRLAPAYEGSISGTVRNAAGSPLSGICVSASSEDDWYFFNDDITDPAGGYQLPNLAQGEYRLWFSDCNDPNEYLSEYYRDATEYEDATPVAVGTTEVSGIDAVLAKGASITGTVTTEDGQPLEEVCVDVYSDDDGSSATTDATGHYLVGALRGGEYVLGFSDCGSEATFVSEFYDDQRSYADADRITVGPDDALTGIDAALERGASISGSILDDDGLPMEYPCIEAYDRRGESFGWDYSFDGSFRIGALPPGPYRLRAEPCSEAFVTEWYRDEPDMESADPVSVGAQENVTGVTMSVSRGGTIEGTVSAAGAGTYDSSCIDVYDPSGNDVGWAYTGEDGTYSVQGLPAGSYRVQFYDCGEDTFASTWYGGAPDFASAAEVHVAERGLVEGIDATLPVAGSISGTITGPGGASLPEVCAEAFDGAGWWLGFDYSESGSYLIDGLRPGDAWVNLTDCWSELAPEWYPNTGRRSAAQGVAVAAGNDTPGIDAELGVGGWLEGAVVDGAGDPIPWTCIDAYDADGNWAGWGGTDEDGVISAGHLYPGEYRLSLADCDWGIFRDEWYEDATSYADATPVPIVLGQATVIQPVMDRFAEGPASLEVRLDGGGVVSSDPAGIDCHATCIGSFAVDSVVTLTAAPDSGSVFVGWKGAGCSGTGTCTIPMAGDRAVRAVFAEA